MNRLSESSACASVTAVRASGLVVRRGGATLVEVLMSLLIMSVGVISVFSLYPIAVLRSIEATQLTNAKILYQNARAELLSSPAMRTGAPEWRPFTFYRNGDVVSVPDADGAIANPRDPFTKFICTNPGLSGAAPPAFRDVILSNYSYGNSRAAVNAGGAVFEDLDGDFAFDAVADGDPIDEVVWQPASADATSIVTYAPSRFLTDPGDPTSTITVVDPYGWAEHHEASLSLANAADQAVYRTLYRDSYGAAPRLDGGLRMLLEDGSAASRSIAAYSGDSTLSVEAAFRSKFGYSLGTLGNADFLPSDFDVALGNEELSAAQVRRIALERTRLPNSYETSFEPIETVSVVTSAGPAAASRLTQIDFPPSPEITALLTQLEATVRGLETQSQTQSARILLRSADRSVTTARWLASSFDTSSPADATPDIDGIDIVNNRIWVRAVDPEDFGAPPAAAGDYPIAMTPINLSGVAATTVTTLEISSVTIEVNESRFTWLATLSPTITPPANVVVFFRRAFDQPVELGYEVALGDDPFIGTIPTAAERVLNERTAWIRVNEGPGTTNAEVAVGRWLFDSTSGRWYQIESIVSTGLGDNGNVIQVELSSRIPEPIANDDLDLGADTKLLTDPQVVIPRGIVEVFPLNLELNQ